MSFSIDKLLRSAKAEIKAGQPTQARSTLLQALEKFPDNARLLTALAEAQQAAISLPPRPFAAPHLHHFLAVKQRFGLAPAIEEMAAAVRLNPGSPWAQGVLGAVLYDAKLYPAAVRHLRLALKLDPNFREAGVNLANALNGAGETAQALTAITQVLKTHADFPPALLLQARLLAKLQQDTQSDQGFTRYLALVPQDIEAAIDHAAILVNLHRLPEAKAKLLHVLQTQPTNARAMGNLGNILLSEGDLAAATRQFEAALALNPRAPIAFFNLGRARDFTADDPLIAQMQALTDDTSLDHDEQVALHFGLAKAFEDIGDADQSFAHLTRANDLRAGQISYHIDQDRAVLADLRARFAAHAGPALHPAAPAKRRPVFVLGMMRSGTTLMEQILSSHPMVHGAGEMEVLPQLAALETARTSGPLDQAALQRIRDGYLAALNAEPGDQPVVVDKLPANFRLIGLIRKALPEARILHMRRDPVAVCWSVYKTMFTNIGIGYAHKLADTIAYYDLYEAMMADWRADYPDGFMDVDYEALTRNPEPTIRAALAYCDLPFDPACLAPQDNQRSVRTASVRQVRSGIYQGSSGKWKAFAPHLAPLIQHFAAKD
ncbi:MAG: Uncharacterized protein FD162_1047 [Rhodobacteraceae bacterium]|nr:MAG: Uncharacterized protein FD162_1047 [Paracoccaceae bacterium]